MSYNQISNSSSAEAVMPSVETAAADSPLPNRAAAATKICEGCGNSLPKFSPSKKRKFCSGRCATMARYY